MAKSEVKDKKWQALLQRYVLTGAAIGFYFGYFFRPVREPNLLTIVGLSAVIVVVTLLLKRPPLADVPKLALYTFIKYGLLLAVLEGRHIIYDLGGRWATVALTGLMGALAGVWFAYDKRRGSL